MTTPLIAKCIGIDGYRVFHRQGDDTFLVQSPDGSEKRVPSKGCQLNLPAAMSFIVETMFDNATISC